MKFRVDINLDNASFEDAEELPRIIDKIARQVRQGQTGMGIIDSNGNRVGQWVVEGDDLDD